MPSGFFFLIHASVFWRCLGKIHVAFEFADSLVQDHLDGPITFQNEGNFLIRTHTAFSGITEV